MIDHWWMAPEWANKRAMEFGKPLEGPFRRVALTTDPEMKTTKQGQLYLTLVNRHPHEALRIFCGDRQVART